SPLPLSSTATPTTHPYTLSLHDALPIFTRELAVEALTMALAHREPGPGLVHHSDRGSQYASGDYRALLDAHGVVMSMSRRGNCRSEEHTSELQSRFDLVCRLLLEKKKQE